MKILSQIQLHKRILSDTLDNLNNPDGGQLWRLYENNQGKDVDKWLTCDLYSILYFFSQRKIIIKFKNKPLYYLGEENGCWKKLKEYDNNFDLSWYTSIN